MNRIVREHYPVDQLPEDLREGLRSGETVRVVLEAEEVARQPLSFEQSMQLLQDYRRNNPDRVSAEQAVAEIRALRDEWDD